MPGTLIIEGANITDTSFSLDTEGFPEIVWNVTRLERDAFAGKFGGMTEVKFSELSIGGPGHDFWKHVDRKKVKRFVRDAAKPVRRGGVTCALIDLPGIAVMLPHPDGVRTCVLPVDGNHRGLARKIMGLPSFRQFIVPKSMEEQYRITIREV